MDAEIITERRIESAARHARESNKGLWVAAYQADKIYGLFQDGATNELAQAVGRTRSAVQKWANAYRCFKACLIVNYHETKYYRREYTLTHFATMWELMQKYTFGPETALFYFRVTDCHRANLDGWSVDVMRQEVEADRANNRAVDWHYYWERVHKPLRELASFDGELPAPVRRWILDGLRLFE